MYITCLKKNSENKNKDNAMAKTGSMAVKNKSLDRKQKVERKGKKQRLTPLH